MESNGEPLKIHISQQCCAALQKLGGYQVQPRGIINMKGKKPVQTYWLVGATEKAVKPTEVSFSNFFLFSVFKVSVLSEIMHRKSVHFQENNTL